MTVRFGIIGIGKISHRFMKGIALVENAKVKAVASRDGVKAKEYASQYRIGRYYDSYEKLAADPDIDAIYIATPPHLHYDHMMLCLRHGKHVICEKPFTVSYNEAAEVFELAKQQGCFVMEAQKSVFLPATAQVKTWLQEKAIGKLQYAEASYCYQGNFSPDHFIFTEAGGSMYDVGVYPLSYLSYVIDEPIDALSFQALPYHSDIYDQVVDLSGQIALRFHSGIMGYVRSSIVMDLPNRAIFYGDQGRIEVEHFWKAQSCMLHTKDKDITMPFPADSEFQYQIREAVKCIGQNKLQSDIMSWQRTLDLMDMLERFASYTKEQWERMQTR